MSVARVSLANAKARRELIARNFLFRDLSAGELDKILALSHLQRFAPRQAIFRKGDPGHGMLAVLSGHVKLCALAPSGKELVFGIIRPGEIFGEIALLDGRERSVDATAIDRCEALMIERRDFVPFLERHPETCIRLMTALCARLRRTSQLTEDSLFLDVPSRLARRLLQLADRYGRPGRTGMRIDLKLSQRELAALVGLSRESINKKLGVWRRDGLIRTEDGLIVLRDIERLRRIAEPESAMT